MSASSTKIVVCIDKMEDGGYVAECDHFIDHVSPLGFGATPYEALLNMAARLKDEDVSRWRLSSERIVASDAQ